MFTMDMYHISLIQIQASYNSCPITDSLTSKYTNRTSTVHVLLVDSEHAQIQKVGGVTERHTVEPTPTKYSITNV